MSYTPNPQSLVYSQLQFISTSVPMDQAKTVVDYDLIYNEVSYEIYALFVGEPAEIKSEAVREYASLQALSGIETSN